MAGRRVLRPRADEPAGAARRSCPKPAWPKANGGALASGQLPSPGDGQLAARVGDRAVRERERTPADSRTSSLRVSPCRGKSLPCGMPKPRRSRPCFIDVLLSGLTLGGMYALIAMGLTLQYGVARIMNLAYGEFLIAAAFGAFVLVHRARHQPAGRRSLLACRPPSLLNWLHLPLLLCRWCARARNPRRARGRQHPRDLRPAVRRQGIAAGRVRRQLLQLFLSDSRRSTCSARTVAREPAARARRRAADLGVGLYLALTRTRIGTAVRAVAVDPRRAPAGRASTCARVAALRLRARRRAGGGRRRAGHMFLTFNASMGVVFTMKALIVVIMGGVGNLLGAWSPACCSASPRRSSRASSIPGLTLAANYALFLAVLLLRPTGLFGRAGAMSRACSRCRVGLARARRSRSCRSRRRLLASALAHQHAELHRAGHRLGAVLRPDALHLARHRRLLRHRRLHGRRCSARAAVAAGAGWSPALHRRARSRSSSALATLRLSGIYFVIFTFGLAELIRQLVTWYEVNVTRSVGRYIFLDITPGADLLAAAGARCPGLRSPAG